MSTFKDFMKDATHYLYEDNSPSSIAKHRSRFVAYCEKHGLDEEFDRLVAEDPEWVKLARETQVSYFEDRYTGSSCSIVLPQISIFVAELGTVPVVKVLTRDRID